VFHGRRHLFRHVLVERAAEGDVENLYPATDGQHRQAILGRVLQQHDFDGVAGEIGRSAERLFRFAVL